jgi:hypothetical protein
LIIAEKKLVAIANLIFSLTLKELKIYLDLTKYLRVYVSWYAQISESLQDRKILLLKDNLIKDKSKKAFAKKISFHQFIEAEHKTYEHLQATFNKESFLRHFKLTRRLFIDVNIFKKRDVRKMMFHVKRNSKEDVIFTKANIKLIMFLSKIFIAIEKRYWSTKLKMTDVIWIVKKIRHLIENSRKSLTIIFIDHFVLSKIIKQTSFTSSNTDKLNLRWMRAFQYLSILSIEIRVKSEKFHIISNAFFRLFSIMNIDQSSIDEENVLKDLQYDIDAMLVQAISEFNTFSFDVRSTYISEYLNICFEQRETLIEMTDEHRNSLRTIYKKDSQWSKLKAKLESREHS